MCFCKLPRKALGRCCSLERKLKGMLYSVSSITIEKYMELNNIKAAYLVSFYEEVPSLHKN